MCLKNYGQRSVILFRSSEQTHLKEKEKQEGKWLSEDSLQIVEERSEKQGRKGKVEFQRIVRRDEKAFFNDQCLKIEEKKRRGKTRDLFRKIGNIKGTFFPKMSPIKERKD